MHNRFVFILFIIATGLAACHKDENEAARLTLDFSFSENGQAVCLDTLLYTNAAGNLYEINEIKFFISDLKLTTAEGKTIEIRDHDGVHYVDFSIPYTLSWAIADSLPVGHYSSLSFRLGLDGQKNTTHYFVNPPENNMAWPDALGGGYHYLMINGKWMKDDLLTPFNFHAGRLILDDEMQINPTFIVTLNNPTITLSNNSNKLTINMEINNWLCNPTLFDFNHFGGSIMTNVEAQQAIQDNGHDVFTLKP